MCHSKYLCCLRKRPNSGAKRMHTFLFWDSQQVLCFLQMASPTWQNLEQHEGYQRLIETVAVLRRLATRLSSRAEIVGAVRQVQLRTNTEMWILRNSVTNAAKIQGTAHCLHNWCFVNACLAAFFNITLKDLYVMSRLTSGQPKQISRKEQRSSAI